MEERKRVILITNSFPFGRGEASFILPELKYLQERMDVTIVSRNHADEMTSRVDETVDIFRYDARNVGAGDLVRYLPCLFDSGVIKEIVRNITRPKHVLKTIKMVLRGAHFADFLKNIRENYTQRVIYYTYWNDYATYGAARHCRKNGDCVISRIHGGDLYLRPTNGYCLPLKSEIARFIDRIFFISEEGRNYFAQTHCSQYMDKYDVCRMGIANEAGVGRGSTDGILRIVSVSNVVYGKRVSLIPDALALVQDLKIEWTHFGDGDEMEQVLASVEKTNSNICCNIMGRVSNEDVMDYYAKNAVDLFVNVSYSEGLPVSMMEAASFGTPLVGTNVGGVCEIITPDNGYLLDRDFTSEQLAQLLCEYAGLSDEEKQHLRAASRKVWQERFVAAKNYQRFAESICSL